MVIGASEAFGLYESEDMEFPAQLDQRYRARGMVEVINTSIVGMTAFSMIRYWESWLAQFRPEVVVIYASPLFYLNDNPVGGGARRPAFRGPRSARGPTSPPPADNSSFGLRLVPRLKDAITLPDFIQKWRERRWMAERLANKGPDWIFQNAPRDRLELYQAHLEELTDSIRASGPGPCS